MRPPKASPPWLWLPALLGVAFFVVPLVGLLARAPWAEFLPQLTSAPVLAALWLSLRCAAWATLLTFVLGLPLAAWLAEARGAAGTIVRVLVTLPMVLPPVVGGVALLLAYGRRGLVGQWLDAWFGVVLPFTPAGVVLAATYVAMPFFVVTVEAALRSFDRRYAEAAASLGAGPWRVFLRVTLPMIAPSLGAGAVLAFARALGEFGATITFAGNLAGQTRTMPLAVYVALQGEPEGAIVLSVLLVLVAALLLFLLRRHWLRVS